MLVRRFHIYSQRIIKEGQNEIVIFETEGTYQPEIQLVKEPLYKEMKEGLQ